MVPMEQRELKVHDYLEALSEERLNQLLHEAVEADEMDVDLIQRINAALSAKSDHAEPCDVEAAWQEFSGTWRENEPLYDYEELGIPARKAAEPQAKTKHTRIRHLTRIAIVAAIVISILALMTLTASAFGVNIWSSIADWTDEHFSFSPVGASYSSYTDELFGQLRADLEARGITADLVPKYFPEGFTVEEYSASENSIYVLLVENDEEIILRYAVHSPEKLSLLGNGLRTKDEGNPERMEAGGIFHYIMTNMGDNRAAWINDNIECDIIGISNRDELVRVIESIY